MRHKQAAAHSRLFGAINVRGTLGDKYPESSSRSDLTFGTHDPETAPRAMHYFNPKVNDSRPATAARRPPRDDGAAAQPHPPPHPPNSPDRDDADGRALPGWRAGPQRDLAPQVIRTWLSLSQPARDGDGEALQRVWGRGLTPALPRRTCVMARRGGGRRAETFPPDVKLHTPTGTHPVRANHVDPAVPIGMQVYVVSKAVLVAMCTEHHP